MRSRARAIVLGIALAAPLGALAIAYAVAWSSPPPAGAPDQVRIGESAVPRDLPTDQNPATVPITPPPPPPPEPPPAEVVPPPPPVSDDDDDDGDDDDDDD